MEWFDKIITPRAAVNSIVESYDEQKIVLIKRKYPPLGLAFPGGFMEVGETISQTAIRETKEEIGLDTEEVGLLHASSRICLDPRLHVVVITAVLRVKEDVEPVAGDDAAGAFWVVWKDLINDYGNDITERTKIEFNEYRKWKEFNKQNGLCWLLPKLE